MLRDRPAGEHEDAHGYSRPRMEVSFLYPSSVHRTGGVVVLYRFASELAERGHRVHFLHGPAWPTRIDSLDELSWFPFPDAVEHHIFDSFDDPSLPEADVVFSPLAPARLGLPATFVQGYRMLPLEIEHAVYRLPSPKACVAKWLVDVGLDLGVPADQLWYVPIGIDHDVFALRTPLEGRPYDLALLYNKHPQKGGVLGLQVIATLRERFPSLRAVVFGPDEPRRLPDGVDFRHWLDPPTLAAEVLGQAKVYVQTSVVEGFGLTPVEAMACGAALVTTDNGGSRDYAIDGETALVVPPGDAGAIADAAEALLRDEERRVRLAAAGERYVRRFTWERGTDRLEAYLRSYVADPDAFRRPPTGEIEQMTHEQAEQILEKFLRPIDSFDTTREP